MQTSAQSSTTVRRVVDQTILLELVSVLQIPVLVEADTFTDLAIGKNQWRLSDSHTLLQLLQCFANTLELGSNERPGVSDSAETQLSKILC